MTQSPPTPPSAHPPPGARSATELYEVQRHAKKVITFCSDFDRILGGGVCTGQVTEFCESLLQPPHYATAPSHATAPSRAATPSHATAPS